MLSYTETIGEGGHPFDCTAQAVTVTLLSSGVAQNKPYTVQKTDSGGNAITVTCAAGDTFVGGATSISIPGGAPWFATIKRGFPGLPILVVSGAGASSSSVGPAPGAVLAITVSGVIDPTSAAMTLTVGVTPPASGAFTGCELWLEIPDQSAVTPVVVGSTPVGSGALTGQWTVMDLGWQPYVAAQQPWIVTAPAPPFIDPTQDTPCRLYASSIPGAVHRATDASPTPNQTFTLQSLTDGKPNAGTNVTGLLGGDGNLIGIVATVLSPVNVTGKLETPVLVDVTDTPPSTSGWVAQLILTLAGADPTQAANQQVVSGAPINQAGPVYAPAGDGIAVPHSFALDTPTVITQATIWLQAGLANADGTFSWNNIVPGITPQWPISYGATTGTTDATAIMTATIAASMAIVNSLFGVAPNGIVNSLLGPAAVATLNIQALAVTNPLLASLAVQSANLDTGSVTATAIAALAVGTSAIQTAAITNALIANLAVSGAQIQSATITGANIALATIAGANIGTATIAQANIANLAVGTAQIQSLAVTDAKINDLSATKITAGTISATISITAPTINGGTITMTANGITTVIDNATVFGVPAGLVTYFTAGSAYPTLVTPGLIEMLEDTTHNTRVVIQAGVSNSSIQLYYPGTTGVGCELQTGLGLRLRAPGGSIVTTLDASGNANIAGAYQVANTQVVSTRVATTPATLADVIAVLQHHGLSN